MHKIKPVISKIVTAELALEPSEAWPQFGEDEIAAVAQVLRSGRVNQWTGECVHKFERAMACRVGMPHAVALANGSLALELALRSLGIGPGDEVIVTPSSFVASTSCVAMVGATPVFADVEPESQNISARTVAPHITAATKAVIAVHLMGWPVDMPPLMALAERHGLAVIEDCAQSIGAAIDGKWAGSFGHASTFSFCQEKIMTTGGEGGMALFRDEGAWKHAWSFKDHGKDLDLMTASPDMLGFRFIHTSIGTNWRMTEMQAAIGIAQLSKLEDWLEARMAHAKVWRDALESCEAVRLPAPPRGVRHANYKLCVFLEPGRLNVDVTRGDILSALVDGGVRAFSGFCPEIYREAAFADLDVETRPTAHALGQRSLMFEVHPTLDPERLRARAARARKIIARFEA